MFNVGDKVVVAAEGHFYDAYEEWAKLHNLHNWTARRWPVVGEEYEIVCRGYHGKMQGRVLYGVRDKQGNEFIFWDAGIKKAPKKVRLDLEIVAGTGVKVREYQPYQLNDTWPISTIEVNLETGEVVQIKE